MAGWLLRKYVCVFLTFAENSNLQLRTITKIDLAPKWEPTYKKHIEIVLTSAKSFDAEDVLCIEHLSPLLQCKQFLELLLFQTF